MVETPIFLSGVIVRVMFYPILLKNIRAVKKSGQTWLTRIDDTIVLGGLPFRWQAQKLVEEEKIKAVLSINEPFELILCPSEEQWNTLQVDYMRINVRDRYEIPSLDKLQQGLEFIKSHEECKSSVYVHCMAGRQRSATFVVCYLMDKHKWTPNQAIDFLKKKRPQIIFSVRHLQIINDFYYKCLLSEYKPVIPSMA